MFSLVRIQPAILDDFCDRVRGDLCYVLQAPEQCSYAGMLFFLLNSVGPPVASLIIDVIL